MIVCHLAHKPFGKYRGKLFSPIASVRLRALEVAPFLAEIGHRVKIVPLEDVVATARKGSLLDADVYILHKALFDVSPLLDELRRAGKRIVVDICDDVLTHPRLSSYYTNLIERADLVTVSSGALAGRVQGLTAGPVVHVPDCVELTRAAPAIPSTTAPVRLLWFGRANNIGPLLGQAPALAEWAARVPASLQVICDDAPKIAPELGRLSGPLSIDTVEWSPEVLEQALAHCHFVLLPTSSAPGMVGKSANRMQETLWAGRLPIAHWVDSYGIFAESAIITEDLIAGLEWARGNPAVVLERIRRGQTLIAERFTPQVVASHWDEAVRTAAVASARPLPVPAARLNLGCGDKLLPGYVNIDIEEGRSGVRPDVVCDLHALTFQADASVDEVLAVHVVEHFWRWEVVDILREWVRVLKPGGRMVLECPNLKSACEAFLRNPDTGASADKRGQQTMWVFYGDPAWRDPLMTHRWGYTPASLAQVMAEAGLVDIHQEPAQFKLRDPRDMRVVGRRPG